MKPYDAIQSVLDKHGIEQPYCGFDIGPGWLPVVDEALGEMIAAGWTKKLAQVKQKFCQLRIYADDTSDELEKIISRAEAKCNKLCEECGAEHGMETPACGMALCDNCKTLKLHEAKC